MPSLSDHPRRDALARLYAEISLELGQYRRRIHEEAKAIVETRYAELAATGEQIDGDALGREAFQAARNRYFALDDVGAAIDADAVASAPALEPGADS